MKQQLLTTLESIENYTLGVAQLMTEDGYEFRPAKEVMNFRELIHHTAYGIYWWEDNFIKKTASAWQPPAVTPGKRETVHYLMQAFASLRKTMNAVEQTEEVVHGFTPQSIISPIIADKQQCTCVVRELRRRSMCSRRVNTFH